MPKPLTKRASSLFTPSQVQSPALSSQPPWPYRQEDMHWNTWILTHTIPPEKNNHLKLILTHCSLFISDHPCTLGAHCLSCGTSTPRDKGREHTRGENQWEYLSHPTQRAKKRKEWKIIMQIESCAGDSKNRWGREHKIKGNNLPWGRRQRAMCCIHRNAVCRRHKKQKLRKQPAKLPTTEEVRKSQKKPFEADTI